MRIGVVTASKSVHVRVYVEYLVQTGHDVTVVTNRDVFEVPGVRTVNIRPLGGRRFKLPAEAIYALQERKLRRVLDRERFDVIAGLMVQLDAVTAALYSPSPVVLTFLGSDLHRREEMPERFAARLPEALSLASVVHACSRFMAEELLALGTSPDRLVDFQYGVVSLGGGLYA